MRLAACLLGVAIVLSAAESRAVEGVPSDLTLREMGLSGLQVLSDKEATAIRGSGFSWGSGKADPIFDSVQKFEMWKAQFRAKVAKFPEGEAKFRKWQAKFRGKVADFRTKVH